MLGGGNDRLFGILCDKLGKPEWKSDPKFVTNADRVKHRDELETLVENITMTKTTDEWLEVLEGCGMPYAKINDVKQTLEHPHGSSHSFIWEFSSTTRTKADFSRTQCKRVTW
jgi:succinate--hydroxymethylglutarate CoA-transferase